MREHDTEIDGTPMDYYAQGGTLVVDEQNAELFRGGFIGMGGFYGRPLRTLAIGNPHKGHEHYINHLGILWCGKARVHWRDPRTGAHGTVDIRVPKVAFHIRADYWHEIEAMTPDAEWTCFFAKAEADRVYGDAAKVDWIMEKEHG